MAAYDKAIEGITSLFSELITDDDLLAKLQFETDKLQFELDKALLQTTTTPRTDAFVKLMIATRDIIIPLFRPIGAMMMSMFGAWCISEGIVLSEGVQIALFGSPLAYGASRHNAKKDEQKTERAKVLRGAKVTDEDFD